MSERVAVVGGGVVGCAVLHALARRGVPAMLLEAEPALALGASGANSGILHTGFDSHPGERETELILRAAVLREELLGELGVNVWRCGARLLPRDAEEVRAVAVLAANAAGNGVEAHVEDDGSLRVPGEAITDPVAFVHALADAARAGGAVVRFDNRVVRVGAGAGLQLELSDGERVDALAVVNCAGLFADELAANSGDALPAVYPRKGEFLVFAPAPDEPPLSEILLPVPSAVGKGVLVFPTLDGHVIAGPTARERTDKRDWSVEPDARELILERAIAMHPALARARLVSAYAGLRPAGRDGANYVIERSSRLASLIHVAAIRSTGLTASLAIGERVAQMLADTGAIALGPERPLAVPPRQASPRAWWEVGAHHHDPHRAP